MYKHKPSKAPLHSVIVINVLNDALSPYPMLKGLNQSVKVYKNNICNVDE